MNESGKFNERQSSHRLASSGPSGNRLILFIGDNDDVIQRLRGQLPSYGYELTVIHGLEKLPSVQTSTPFIVALVDVVFADNKVVGGNEIKRLRDQKLLLCPIIFLSERDDVRSRLAAIQAGGDGYLVKPFAIGDLIRQIDRLSWEFDEDGYRVLIVDDDVDASYIIGHALNKEKINTRAVTNPLNILNDLKQFLPDVILMDINMPECNGYDLARVIRQIPEYIEIPLIFMTSTGGLSRKISAYVSGGDEFMEKTNAGDTLVSMVRSRARRHRELNRLNERLESNEKRFQQSLTFANIGVWDWTIATGRVGWSEQIPPMFGYAPDMRETNYDHFLAAVHPQDRKVVEDAVSACVHSGTEIQLEHRVIWPDGTVRWLQERGDVVRDETGKAQHILGVVQDITTRRQAEESLQALNDELEQRIAAGAKELINHEQRFSAFIENVPGAVYVCELAPPQRMSFISQAVATLVGWSSADFLAGRINWVSVIVPEDQLMVDEMVTRGIASHQPYSIDYRVVHKSGEVRWVYEIGRAVYDASDHPLYLEGNIFDNSERKRVEHERERLVAILESTPDFVGTADIEGRVLFLNQATRNLLGLKPEETITDIHIADTHPAWANEIIENEMMPAILKSGVWTGESAFINRDGHETLVLQVALAHKSRAGKIEFISFIARDITTLKNTERQANRAQRLEAIGTLAGGIAHDLNNALAPIFMGIQLVRKVNPTQLKILDSMESSAKHAADMVRQLVTFAKGAEIGQRILIQPTHLIKEMEKIITSTFPKNIDLRVKLAKKTPAVLGDPTQLHQVLLNLCVNARDAMAFGGILTLELEAVEIDAAFAGSASLESVIPGLYILIRVTDTGSGIRPEDLDKIFDPFFTTKPPDKGTGLGLSTVMGIVKGYGGFVKVNSHTGQGTTFAIYLPAQRMEAMTASFAAIPEDDIIGKGELILYVDDEAPIRAVMQEALKELNFTPLFAIDGADGLIQAAQHCGQLRVVITDLHMPHMDGVAFVRALRRLLPEIPVIVASGRLEDNQLAELRTLGVRLTLDKPFTKNRLSDVLKAALSLPDLSVH